MSHWFFNHKARWMYHGKGVFSPDTFCGWRHRGLVSQISNIPSQHALLLLAVFMHGRAVIKQFMDMTSKKRTLTWHNRRKSSSSVPPRIQRVPSNGVYNMKSGSAVRLTCNTEGSPRPNITWTRIVRHAFAFMSYSDFSQFSFSLEAYQTLHNFWLKPLK